MLKLRKGIYMNEKGRKEFDLEKRLINFSVSVMDVAEALPDTRTGNYLSSQLVRSGTSPALNYGEAQSAESRKDFIHKMRIVLRELRETNICLRIISRKEIAVSEKTAPVLSECEELVRICAKSVCTAESRLSASSAVNRVSVGVGN